MSYLFAHSYYSLKYGVISPKVLVSELKDLGYSRFILADINNTTAILETTRLSQIEGNPQCIPAVDIRNGNRQEYLLVAKNNSGFLHINEFLSAYIHSKNRFPEKAPQLAETIVVYPYTKSKNWQLEPNEYLGLCQSDINKILWKKNRIDLSKIILSHQATIRHKRDFNTHRLLRAIDLNTLLSKLDKKDQCLEDEKYISAENYSTIYKEFQEVIDQTNRLLDRCTFHLEFGTSKNLQIYTSSQVEDYEKLRSLAYDGISFRYATITKEITDRIEKELDIIQQKGFITYFLINWDMLCYARSKGYFYVGRGSGANSLVAYLLRITDVDPIELDLYFERFINLYRENPPDFDIDFSWKDRNDVLNYLFTKYKNIALLATYNTFQYKGVIRELGKVFGMPPHEMELLSGDKEGKTQPDSLAQLVIKYGKLIHGLPNHLSIHAGGVLISDDSLYNYSATFLATKGLPCVQFDMHVAEDIGLYKFDILSQRGLAKVQDALQIIKENYPAARLIDLQQVQDLKKDPKTLKLLHDGDAIGCFYVESPAMRMLFKKLRVKDYLGLVAASSIIRPGVAQSGMMNEYIKRYRNPELRKEAHPILLEIMPETFGVMVYQEDVIKVAHYFAGLTLAESDVLRRGMSGKYRGREEFVRCQKSYFENCKNKGYSDTLAHEIWRQIESFAGYAFSKGHSASYAVESFQALYLKAHFPLEYMTATLNNGGGFYNTESYLHEAKQNGALVHLPCVNTSFHLMRLIEKDLYIGFGFVETIQEESSLAIVQARDTGGIFESFSDFIDRVPIEFEQLIKLININAFRFTNKSAREILFEAYRRLNRNSIEKLPQLFKNNKLMELPHITVSPQEEAFDQLEFLGFPLQSPFSILKHKLLPNHILANDFKKYINKKIMTYGYLVTIKNTKTIKNELMMFSTFTDLEGQFIDGVHFPEVCRNYRFQGKGIYCIEGIVREDYDFITLEVQKMNKEVYIDDVRFI